MAVRYSGCEMEVLASCSAPGKYRYTALTPKRDRVTIKSADELYAAIPLGAAKLEGKLETAGQLDVDMSVVGRYAADKSGIRADDLEGPDCAKATHVVSALTVGAFDFFAGADGAAGASARVGVAGGAAASRSSKELLNSDGRMRACDGATGRDAAPPDGCGAVLRLEVAPLATAKPRTGPPGGKEPEPDEPSARGAGGKGELKLEVPSTDYSFRVRVEAEGARAAACAEPVTYYKPCRLGPFPEGKAKVVVAGDAAFEREVRVSDDGVTKVRLMHRGRSAEVWLGGLTAVSGGLTAYGLLNGDGLSRPAGGGSVSALNIVLVTLGGTFTFVFGLGFLGALLSDHDAISVEEPERRRAAATAPRWGGPLAPTTLRF